MPTNSAAALGQAAGELFEKSVLDILSTTVQERGYTVKSDKLRDAHDTPYSIDAVIYDDKARPIILIDTKYIRYKKHNRDKASWVCTAHSLLRKHHKTLRKSIVVLGGQWSQPSLKLLDQFDIEVIHAPFDDFVSAFGNLDIEFDWEENDRTTPDNSLSIYNALSDQDKASIGDSLTLSIKDKLIDSVLPVLESDIDSIPHNISHVEILLKTDQNQLILFEHDSLQEALTGLLALFPPSVDASQLTSTD